MTDGDFKSRIYSCDHCNKKVTLKGETRFSPPAGWVTILLHGSSSNTARRRSDVSWLGDLGMTGETCEKAECLASVLERLASRVREKVSQ